MATTTNYSWTTPDDTGLVKDGASAIRTLGSSIDTTTKNLNPSTTLGDIEYRSSTANTNTRLAIGSTGQVLTVSGGVPAWATATTGLTLISTTALSGASTTISSIPTTYKELRLILIGLGGTADNFCQMRVNGDTGNNYQFSSIRMTNTTQSQASSSTTAVSFFDSAFICIESNDKSSALFEFPAYTSTSGEQAFYSRSLGFQTSGQQYMVQCFGSYAKSAAITSITFISPTGTFDAGNAYLYGVS